MYRPLLLAAWYSSAGMDRNLSVFMDGSWFVSPSGGLFLPPPIAFKIFPNRFHQIGKKVVFPSKNGLNRSSMGLFAPFLLENSSLDIIL